MRAKTLSLSAGAILLASCAVNPKATQLQVVNGDDLLRQQSNAVATYYMQASQLDISFKNTAEAGKPAKWVFTVVNTPIEDTERRFLLLQNSDLFSRTTLVAAKRQNTDLLSSIGSEVTDNRVTLLQNVGAVAKLAIGTFVSREGVPDPNKAFTTRFVLKDPNKRFHLGTAAPGAGQAWISNDYPELSVLIGDPPVTAFPYQPALFRQGMQGVFAASCRPTVISYTAPDNSQYEWRGKIADAETVEFTPLPRKGKIEYHDQCGTSVSNEKDPTKTTDDIVAAAVAQAAALKEAYDKAAKE